MATGQEFQAVSWDNKLGALLIGGLTSGLLVGLLNERMLTSDYMDTLCRLYGITCTQTYLYFEKSFHDRRSLKLFVRRLFFRSSCLRQRSNFWLTRHPGCRSVVRHLSSTQAQVNLAHDI